ANLGGVQANSINFDVGLANIDPNELVSWGDSTRTMFAAVPDAAARLQIFGRRAMVLLAALAKDEPKATASLKFDTGFGAVNAKVKASLSPQMGTDPALKSADGSADSWKLVVANYLAGSGELKIPALAAALLTDPITQGNLVQEGFFTQEGDSVTTSVNYAGGHLSVAGRQIF
ncbi:MAG TPA: hypothetical protein VMT58_07470, partial [Candidatus Binataceae bacterium]|nr:hypothetical protein [Candidatus Binataceae bacterium]